MASELTSETSKRKSGPQRQFPAHTLEEALRIITAIGDLNAGKPMDRLLLAKALGRSPASSEFRVLISSSAKYGLTEGSEKSDYINPTHLGLRIVKPMDDAERFAAIREAVLVPELIGRILRHYDRSRFPQRDFLKNALERTFGVDVEHSSELATLLFENARFAGFLEEIQNSVWLRLEGGSVSAISPDPAPSVERPSTPEFTLGQKIDSNPPKAAVSSNDRVFITHGKNVAVVEQLKELLKFGKFTPVVAIEHETVSKPVPDKVLDDMRSCFAGIIHVAGEEKLLDTQGEVRHTINSNVLIEIGAAMALYSRNLILLVQKGVHLPSNLQGMYRCEYDGDRLDYDATMKLLKAFNEFE